MYRYDPEKVKHLHKATDFAADHNKTVESHLGDEFSGIVTNLDDCGMNTSLDPSCIQAGIQHPKVAELNKNLQELRDLTHISYEDP